MFSGMTKFVYFVSYLFVFTGNKPVSEEVMTLFLSKKNNNSFLQRSANEINKYYREIPSDIINQIRDLYTIDFEMFEYGKYLAFEESH